ncbi:MAG TPA: NYN domain-containing protein [Vicinamibacterales bacterium]|nr:NYN domain-containing protein [Vicinamibacterales bacterium]
MKIAVFVDFDNIEIGVRTTLGAQFDIGPVLEALKERGEVVSKTAYSDWKRAGDHSRTLTQHAMKMVQRNLTPGGDKNGADINLALDALEMAFTHPHINAYVIVGGDSDFISLVEKLKQYDKKVFVVGGRSFTSNILQTNCHEFIAYENLIGVNGRRSPDRGRGSARGEAQPIELAIPLVRRALKVLADREVSPQLGLLKSTLLQLDSTFSERNYGASTFRDFAERLEKSGVVSLKVAGRNILVELKDDERGSVEEGDPGTLGIAEPAQVVPFAPPVAPPVPADPALQTEGVAEVRRLLGRSTALRFPMYVRNVRQALRAADASFDERRFGFGGLMDLLRACQRDGLLRLERDRRGALRVFPGSQLGSTVRDFAPVDRAAVQEAGVAADAPLYEAEPVAASDIDEPVNAEGVASFESDIEDESSAHVTDTTAEMLARAAAGEQNARRRRKAGGESSKPRRTSTRQPRGSGGRARSRKSPSGQA